MQTLSKYAPLTPVPLDSARFSVNASTEIKLSDLLEVSNIGQIARVAIGGKWKREPAPIVNTPGGVLQQFNLETEQHTHLCFYYRGAPASQAATDAFRSVLGLHPHLLDMDERKSVEEILREKIPQKGFAYCSIKTVAIGLRMVLVVEGVYKQHNMRTITVFIDASKKHEGSAVQEVTFLAPRDAFYKHYPTIMNAFKSLKWL
ncbi:MAG TPA: hypothetical protein V6C81_24270 [Planktothrix sp.]|jgi:hypothetical protein